MREAQAEGQEVELLHGRQQGDVDASVSAASRSRSRGRASATGRRYSDAQAIAARGRRGLHRARRSTGSSSSTTRSSRRSSSASPSASCCRSPSEALAGERARAPQPSHPIDFFFEPEPRQILERLLPVYVETQLYRALLESAASFFGAQMTAMRNASKAAGELIDSLTLAMNRARQAEITQEILEVVAGADALTQ